MLIVVDQGSLELDIVIPAAKLTNDRMNRLAGFLLTSIAGAFLLVTPKQCLAQTQLVPVKVAVPASFRSSPFERDLYLQVPRGFQIRVISRIPAARFLAPTPEGGVLVSQPSRGRRSHERILTSLQPRDGFIGRVYPGTLYLPDSYNREPGRAGALDVVCSSAWFNCRPHDSTS